MARNSKVNTACFQCGKTFKRNVCHLGARNFCSRKCSATGHKKRPILWKGQEKPKCIDCGKPIWYKSKRCGHCCKSGKNSWKWAGGITPVNTKIRMSDQSLEWRKKVFYRDNYTCQHCCSSERTIQAHHIKEFATYPELRFSVENGLTLCKLCHRKHHKIKNLYQNFDPNQFFVRLVRQI
jgi:hypothetical protein